MLGEGFERDSPSGVKTGGRFDETFRAIGDEIFEVDAFARRRCPDRTSDRLDEVQMRPDEFVPGKSQLPGTCFRSCTAVVFGIEGAVPGRLH